MIEINLKSFPKHKVNLLSKEGFIKSSTEVDDGLEALTELIRQDNVFDDMKLQRQVNIACKLFKPTKIRIKDEQ